MNRQRRLDYLPEAYKTEEMKLREKYARECDEIHKSVLEKKREYARKMRLRELGVKID